MSTSNSGPRVSTGNVEPDANKALELVLRLMALRGRSGEEGRVVELIRSELIAAGANAADIETDDAPTRSPLGGEVGNLVFRLPGTSPGPRRLLMAHMDTVPLCVGCKPTVVGKFVESADKTTGLGADDRGGCAVVLTAALEILRRKLPHPPLTFFWPVQEEVGLFGVRYCNLGVLGKPELAFNWDGGAASKITIGATGAFRLEIAITGLAAHAGNAPERGVSAITIAALAIAKLHQHGWLGLIERDGYRGTSNVGVVRGGDATNVITERVDLRAECRSHDPKFRRLILDTICEAFRNACDEVRSVDGACGSVAIEHRLDYESFELKENEACVLAAERAVAAVGLTPLRAISNGGLDANWLTLHGVPTVTMGCGQMDVHTNKERLDIEAFQSACRVALRLATGL
ncbi:MAG: M20/M25/M40 family metallo-hydrolase [Planctomycetia bacterium]|nr:M20/M25/M40 family metallo-hydrolase [Planctomycetia bacterium]